MPTNNVEVPLPAQSAAAGDVVTQIAIIEQPEDANRTLLGLYLSSPTLVTGVATNNATISFRQVRSGSVVVTLGSLQLASGTNLPAETTVTVPITNTPTFQPGDVVDVLQHQNGTGLALPAGIVAEVELD